MRPLVLVGSMMTAAFSGCQTADLGPAGVGGSAGGPACFMQQCPSGAGGQLGDAGADGSGGRNSSAGMAQGGNGGNGQSGSGGSDGGNGGSTGGGSAGSSGSGAGTAGSGGVMNGTGGSAGSSGSGAGTAGSGGSPPAGCGTVLDTLEDGDELICAGNGRNGDWFAWTVGGIIVPPNQNVLPSLLSLARGASQHAMHFTGAGTTMAGVGFTFATVASVAVDYDASMYTGIEFWGIATTNLPIAFNAAIAATDAIMYGGNCVSGCVVNTHPMALNTSWTKYQVPFTALVGGNAPFDPETLRSVTFQSAGSFDLWIDDVAFY